jgi:hypothetical protein
MPNDRPCSGSDGHPNGIAIIRVFGRAALLRRPRIQGRAAPLPYREGEEICALNSHPFTKKLDIGSSIG